MAVDRKLLKSSLAKSNNSYLDASEAEQQLLTGKDISQFAIDSGNFGSGKAGYAGLAAQLATAGIGAYTTYKARQKIVENEAVAQQSFAAQFPQFADLASQLSPETRQAYTLEVLKSNLPKAADNQIISGEQGYFSVNKSNPASMAQPIMGADGQIIKPQKPSSTTINVGEQQGFKNETTLRGEYLDKSKDFVGTKQGYEKVKEAINDPSPVGDIAAIYGFMKAQDPTSTVRESEFATLANAQPLLEKYGMTNMKKVWKGERLTPEQRNDILVKTSKIYDRSAAGQDKLAKQYSDIAVRNGLDPNNIIIDSGTTMKDSPKLDQNQFSKVPDDAIAAEIARRKGGRK